MVNDAFEQNELLQKLKRMAKKDDRIIGMWTVGSMATGKTDRFSYGEESSDCSLERA